MKVVIEFQEAFRIHYQEDKFEDSLKRIYDDMVEIWLNDDYSASGNYELELLNELKRAFPKSYQIDSKSGKWVRDEFGRKCSCCGLYAYRNKFGEPWESDFCPNCGARMEEEK